MKIHKRDTGNESAKPREHSQPRSHSWKPHRDWRVWIAVLLIALVIGYVLLDSLALIPGNRVTQPMPEMGAS
jgi:hypothetical protein